MKKTLTNFLFFLMMWLVYVLINIGIVFLIYFINNSFKFSASSFLQFNHNGDYFLLFLIISLFILGIYLMIKEYNADKFKQINFYNFFIGNLGAMLVISSLLTILSALVVPLNKYTSFSIKNIIQQSYINYILGYVFTFIMIVYMFYLNRHWIEKNNWYLLETLIAPLIYIRFLIQNHIRLNNFLNDKNTTYKELAKMFNDNKMLDLTLINGTEKVSLLTLLFTFFTLILIGGLIRVIKIWKKQIQKS